MVQGPNLASWRTKHWATAIATLLLITLTPLAWIQWQQFKLLDNVADNQVDSLMWQAYQLERELSALDHTLNNGRLHPEQIDPYTLTERYEVFLSRIDLITKIPRRDLVDSSDAYTQVVRAMDAFVAEADPAFADPVALLQNQALMARLDASMEAMRPQLGELTREANRAVARFVDERNAQLHQQSTLVITLAAVQTVVMLLFVVVLVRHLRRQQQQYARLQKLSRELADAKDQAEAANHGKSVFLANMSHEIRTPFQGLLGMLNLLDEPNLSGQQRDYLQTAKDSALHLLGVLNDILDVSTMESGTLKLSVAPVNLRGVVQEVDGLMQVAASDKGLELNMYAASDLPEWVMADATRVRQIMFNLINNAIKFTPQGNVMAELARAPDGQDGLVLTVRDTGVGMDRETVARLFTRFYQADNSLRRRIGGTGLGLEISRNLARMMGGDIQVSSEPGVGSVFTVTLRLPEAQAPQGEGVAERERGQSRRLRVLVAEDHPINLKYMSILLEKMGHDAVFCENGQEALQLLARQPFDVVLLDYHMPVLDGLATTEAIRELNTPAADIKIILVTADVVNDTRKRALEVGVDEFASKPLQADDLQRALDRCGLRDAPGAAPVPHEHQPHPTSFPLSAYERLVRLPEPPLPSLSQPATTPAPAVAERVIDPESYREILSMMPQDAMDEMLATLFDPPDGTVPVLMKSLQGNDRADIGYQAHKLKGTAMLLGLRLIVKTSALIEHLATETTEAMPAHLSAQLMRDVEVTQQALREFDTSPAPGA